MELSLNISVIKQGKTMSKVYVSKKVKFCAAHRLHSDALSDTENKLLYGKCNNFNGHGHNYSLEVTFEGEIDPVTGMVVNFSEIKQILEKHIIDKFDHKHIDKEIFELEGLVSTAENLAVICWQLLEKANFPAELYKVALQETDDNVVEYYGE